MMRKHLTQAFLLLALTLTLTLTVCVPSAASSDSGKYPLSVSPTNWYLPRGYKVHAQIWIPAAPLFPGEQLGGAVGVQGKYCTIYVRAYGWKNPWNWFQYKSALRVVKVCGSLRQVVADVQVTGDSYYTDVIITYDWDGYVTIAAATSKGGHVSALYGFSAGTDRYVIVAEGAKVDQPQPLPRPTTTHDSGTGNGYNPPTINDIQKRYILLGAGIGALIIGAVVLVMKGRGRRGKASAAIIAVLLIALIAAGITAYVMVRHSVVYLTPAIKLSEEIGPMPVLTTTHLTLTPGTVLEVTGDEHGWQIKTRDTILYEKLELSNVDLSLNDVIAPILYDWYFDGQDDYIWFIGFNTQNFTSLYIESRYQILNPGTSMKVFTSYSNTASIFWGVTSYLTWFEAWNSTSTGVTNGRVSSYAFGSVDNDFHRVGVYYDGSKLYGYIDGTQISSYDPVANGYDDGPIKYVYKICIGSLGGTAGFFHGRISYVLLEQTEPVKPTVDYVVDNPIGMMSATFYNGTKYFDLITGVVGTPYGGVTRVPTDHPVLFLVKSLASDNKLHFEWFPEGTIIRIEDSEGNVVREFTISGTPVNSDKQVEDYAISLDTTTLPGATVEALVPAFKVRVYGPYGATVKIEDSEGNVYGEGVINGKYVDIPLSHELKDAVVVVGAPKIVKDKLDVVVKECGDGYVNVTVMDGDAPVPGMLVRVADPSNVVVAAGITGSDGQFRFKPSRPLPSATIEVSGVWDGAIQYVSKTVTLSAKTEAGTATPPPQPTQGSRIKWLLVGAFVLLLVVAVAVLTRRRSGRSGLSGVIVSLGLIVVIVAVMAPLAGATTLSTRTYTIHFTESKVIYVNSTLSKSYDLGCVAGNATIKWEGKGSGYAYFTAGTVRKALDLSINGSTTLQLSGSDARINLDSNALWHGTITVVVHDTFKIRVTLSRTTVSLKPGSTATVSMTISKVSGLDRYVTLQYSVPSQLRMSVSPQPPYVVGSRTVTISIRALPNAYGTYSAKLYIYAYSKPTNVVSRPPKTPPIFIPWGRRPNVPSYWVMAGELDVDLSGNSGNSLPTVPHMQLRYVALGVGALILLAAVIAVMSKRGRR